MTISWLRLHPESDFRPRLVAAPTAQEPELPEFDEDGRRYAFRFPRPARQPIVIDRDRIFEYMASHRLPGPRDRIRLRDERNTANFYEDVREIQTHPDVVVVQEPPRDNVRSIRSRKALQGVVTPESMT